MLRWWIFMPLGAFILLLSSCQSKATPCLWETGTPRYITTPPGQDLSTPLPISSQTPGIVVIRGRKITVNKVIEGPLCNDTWSGVVYVTCNVQVYPWVEEPLFLKDCDLSIAPDTVIYVAYHNDTAYYKGCSCHTGETEGP